MPEGKNNKKILVEVYIPRGKYCSYDDGYNISYIFNCPFLSSIGRCNIFGGYPEKHIQGSVHLGLEKVDECKAKG